MSSKLSIPDFFSERNVFLTGGSGFLGKVLVEKLLRSCPKIGKIYFLLRQKQGYSVQERLKKITDLPLFDILKKENPDAIKKIVPIGGDVRQLGLGLSDEDQNTLIENVHIVYHSAASVRFDDSLRDAVLLNTRGTRETVNLSLKMKRIMVFVHISTTFCNTDRKVVDEVLYPPHANWHDVIKAAEEFDPFQLSVLSEKVIEPFRNTYTFSKHLSEHVVNDLSVGKMPTVIYRPSVVIPSIKEPFPGWVDNLNGPVGLLIAGGKGLLRSSYGSADTVTDFVNVDLIAKSIITATWDSALHGDPNELAVFNGSKGPIVPLSLGDIITMGTRLTWDAPFTKIMWYPNFSVTSCWYEFFIKTLLYQMLPAIFLDIFLMITGHEPILIKIQRKIYIAHMAVVYFTHNSWSFPANKCLALDDKLLESDKEAFGTSDYGKTDKEDAYNFFKMSKIAVQTYVLKERIDLKEGKANTFRFWVVDTILKLILCFILLYVLFIKFSVANTFHKKFNDYTKDL